MIIMSIEKIDEVKKSLSGDIDASTRNAMINRRWNVTFRVILLFVGIFIVVCSSITSSEQIVGEAHEYWSVASAILGGASTALSAFAFNQFNFEARQRVWLDKVSALKALNDRMAFGDQSTMLLDDLATVRSWHDFNSPQNETFRRIIAGYGNVMIADGDVRSDGQASSTEGADVIDAKNREREFDYRHADAGSRGKPTVS